MRKFIDPVRVPGTCMLLVLVSVMMLDCVCFSVSLEEELEGYGVVLCCGGSSGRPTSVQNCYGS